MRSLELARLKARECRARLGGSQAGLLERLERHLREEYRVRIYPVAPEFLEDGAGEIDTSGTRPRLQYDERLDDSPAEKLELFAHEFGHLVLHQRLINPSGRPDPVLGSVYLVDGAPVLARYNPRSREEAEANAFATEFVCPPDEVFARWHGDPNATPKMIAAELGLTTEMIWTQLAEGLYRFLVTADEADPGSGEATPPPNPEQERAATYKGTAVLVDAGPGTGKTKTLVQRIVHLLNEHGAEPEDLLVLTFSREAAEVLRRRASRAIKDEARAARIEIATFHEFGVKVLVDHGHLVGLPEQFRIFDAGATQDVVRRVLGSAACDAILKLKDLDETSREVTRHITYLKDRLYTPERLAGEIAQADGEEARALHAIFKAYEAEKRALGAVDFADLILLPIRILRHPELRTRFQQKYRWVMVDEYQDVSRSVATLLKQLCGADNRPWVVGDARQAIYRFRGAAPENVTDFSKDFKDAVTFTLPLNYRSSAAVVAMANQLASMMPGVAPDRKGDTWRAATEPAPVVGPAVEVVQADSDRAEYEAVATRVRRWMAEEEVPASQIAVLARRNIDVRNITLALHQAGIPAVTTGLVTSEGAGGDLAAVLAFPDAPRAALPRLIHTFGYGRVPTDALNQAVRQALASLDAGGVFPLPENAALPAASAVREVAASLISLRFTGDAWDVLCAFLFGHGQYLRGLLARRGEAAAALNLVEVLTTLGLAAAHRVAGPPAEPRASRLAFSERFRTGLTEAAGGTLAPRPGMDAVRVMTCHASKGLEFPFVAVAGQSLPPRKRGYLWLPLSLQPKTDDDALQADALLFVGVTRARRAVSVSFASSKSGLPNGRARQLPALLVKWKEGSAVPVRNEGKGPVTRDTVVMGPIWGGSLPATLTGYTLTGDCEIRTYLEEHLGIDFPPAEAELYSKFVWRCRHTLRRIAALAHERGAQIPPDEAEVILRQVWPEDEFLNHPHLPIFLPRAVQWVRSFAAEYDPGHEPAEVLGLEVEVVAGDTVRPLRSDLVAHVRTSTGTSAVLFRPDALELAKKGGGINWSSLKPAHRLVLVLLQERDPALRPSVFVGPAGRIFPYNWSTRNREDGLQRETAAACASLASQAAGRFEHVVDDFGCDRCAARIVCPIWIGALGPPDRHGAPDLGESGVPVGGGNAMSGGA